MRKRGCNDVFWVAVAGALVLVGIILLFLIPSIVWLVLLAVLAGIGLTCLFRTF